MDPNWRMQAAGGGADFREYFVFDPPSVCLSSFLPVHHILYIEVESHARKPGVRQSGYSNWPACSTELSPPSPPPPIFTQVLCIWTLVLRFAQQTLHPLSHASGLPKIGGREGFLTLCVLQQWRTPTPFKLKLQTSQESVTQSEKWTVEWPRGLHQAQMPI